MKWMAFLIHEIYWVDLCINHFWLNHKHDFVYGIVSLLLIYIYLMTIDVTYMHINYDFVSIINWILHINCCNIMVFQ